MPYTVHHEEGFLRIVFHGTFVNDDLSRGGDEIDRIERASVLVPPRVSDFRSVERLEIDFHGVFALAQARRRLAFTNSFKSALISPGLVHFGFARMFQILNDHPQICIAIFGDEDSAMEWLRTPGQDPPEVEWHPSHDWHSSHR